MSQFASNVTFVVRIALVLLVGTLSGGAVSYAQTTVTVATLAEPGSNSFNQVRALYDVFEQSNPDIDVELQYIEGYGEQVLVRIAAGSPPDLMWVGNNAPGLAEEGYLYDLTGLIERDNFDLSEYIPSLVEAYSYKGRVYGLPNDSAPHIFYYNRNMLEAAGINPDTLELTWENLVEYGKKLTQRGADGSVTQWGFGPLFWNEMVMSWVWQNEGALLNASLTEPTVNTPEFIGGIEYLYDLVYEHQIAPPFAEANTPPPWERFINQEAAILQQGAWLASTMLRDVEFEWGMLVPSKGKVKATGISYGGFAIPYNAAHPEEAWRLLQFMTSKEGQTFLIQQGYAALPAHREAIQDPDNLEMAFGDPDNPDLELDVIVDSALVARTLPVLPEAGEIAGALGGEMAKVWAQEVPVHSAVVNLDQRIRSILKDIESQ